MRGSTRALALAVALAACSMTAAHADDNSTIEERMSYKDFTRGPSETSLSIPAEAARLLRSGACGFVLCFVEV